MRKKLLGALLVVAILAIAGIVATRVSTTEASAKPHSTHTATIMVGGTDAQQSESTGKPFIGIAITSVSEDSDTDGALIVRVIEDSAADGSLQASDIITALDGESVSGPRDVVRIVREHSPGDVIVFSIVRNGASMDISITVGERESSDDERASGKRSGDYKFDFFGRADESLVLSEARYLTDGGAKTVRKAFGAAQNIDADAGTFDLLLRDDSQTLSFTIDDNTKIATDTVEGEASLSDLSADVTTLVTEVTLPDGTREVQYVAQGEISLMMYSLFGRNGFDRMPRMGRGDSDGFSPQRFFFRWFSDRNGNQERRGNGRN